MEELNPTHVVELLILLLIAASLIAMVTRRLRLPYTIALVFGGFLIDIVDVPLLTGPEGAAHWLTPEIIFMVFLPGLLFEAGININVRHLLENLTPIFLVSIFGVIIATIVTGYGIAAATTIPLGAALVFGALISATDPISVLALFKQLGVSKRLSVLVEGESLFNDGTAVVLFQILVASAATGDLSIKAGIGRFFVVAVGGAAIGLGLGYLASRITERIDDPQVEITLTTILAYGSFILAEHFHLSGVIATVAAGLMIGNFGAEIGMSSRTRVALWSFWEYVGFVANSLVFLLIGLEVHILDLIEYWQPILIAILVVLAARALAVYTLVPISDRFSEPIPTPWRHVMVWGGIHGGVSIALALSLAPDFPQRSLILAMTFGVVAFSIVVQGLTITPLMAKLGVEAGEEDEYDRTRVRQMAAAAALEELERLRGTHQVTPPIFHKLRTELEATQLRVEDEIKQLHLADAHWAEEEERVARSRLIRAERTAIQRAATDGLISHHTAEVMAAHADEELEKLSGQGGHA
ncbi:MAG: Na+/H+ antiporter [Bryobacterales bacterium]|nr:Na+/H+ antiporter [Bryobacterales bacterium]